MHGAVVVPIKHVGQLHARWRHPSLEVHVSSCIVPSIASDMSLPFHCKPVHLRVTHSYYSMT